MGSWMLVVGILVYAAGLPESVCGGIGPLAWAQENSQVANNLYGVVNGNGRLVVSGDGGVILTSLDGATWVQDVSGINPINTLWSATYGGGLFVVAGDGGTILTSNDGTNWASQVSAARSNDVPLLAVSCHNGFFVVGGTGGTILTSRNGTNWATQASAAGVSDVVGLTFGKGLFVVVGAGGLIMSSADGTNWAAQVSGIAGDYYLNGVAYGNGTFVVVGDAGIVLSSSNGTNWTQQSSLGVGTNDAVAFGNGRFVTVVDDGSIWSSADGTNWMAEFASGGASLFGVSFYQGDQFIATGALGTILLGGSVRLGPISLPGNGTLQFNVMGPNGLRVVAESTATLSAPGWQPIATNTIANGFSLVVDRATNAARFYRARSD